MGLSISKLIKNLFKPKKELKILMLGLDAAGKTTILFKLRLGEVIKTVPTIGFNVETIQFNNIKFTLWDVGAQDKIRLLWRHYYINTQAIIFVVDSADKARIELVKEELRKLLAEEELKDAALLILANKHDIGVMSVSDIVDILGLPTLRERQWHIEATSAWTGKGLYEGFGWLSKIFKHR